MVEDDGLSYNYTKGDTRTTAYYWNEAAKTLSWKVSGSYSGKNGYKTIKAVLGKEEKGKLIGKEGSLVFK
ncbi:MAG: yicI 2 [Mucilaginibacter sp.]|nr:yicI 2 [Mucilaginibacter sp.]